MALLAILPVNVNTAIMGIPDVNVRNGQEQALRVGFTHVVHG